MTSWLVFLKSADEEFVLPVMAPDRSTALKAAASAYPAREYTALTCYAENELQQVLSGAQQWSASHAAPSAVADTPAPSMAAPAVAHIHDEPTRQAELKAAAAMMRMQRKRDEQMFGQPLLPEPVKSAPVVTPASSVATPSAERYTQPAAMRDNDTDSGVQPVTVPVPQDLKTVLALLKAAPATVPATQPAAGLSARVEEVAGTPLPASVLGMMAEPTSRPAISRRPSAAETVTIPPQRTVLDVFKGLRK